MSDEERARTKRVMACETRGRGQHCDHWWQGGACCRCGGNVATDEQRVRTMAGWIGVEISRSRVRTAGKPGYGLYRVRGQDRPSWSEPYRWERWTAYAFTLEEIETEIEVAIGAGIPAGPSDLWLRPAGGGGPVGVTTRWTSAYRGSRTLGYGGDPVLVAATQDFSDQLEALVAAVGEGFEMRHVSYCACEPPTAFTAGCVVLNRETVRSRQRAANADFQTEHQAARAVGLERRHAAKLARNAEASNSPGSLGGPAQLDAERFSGAGE